MERRCASRAACPAEWSARRLLCRLCRGAGRHAGTLPRPGLRLSGRALGLSPGQAARLTERRPRAHRLRALPAESRPDRQPSVRRPAGRACRSRGAGGGRRPDAAARGRPSHGRPCGRRCRRAGALAVGRRFGAHHRLQSRARALPDRAAPWPPALRIACRCGRAGFARTARWPGDGRLPGVAGMNEQAVRARACEVGLAIDWVDAMGRPQQVKTEALRRILDSLDVPQDGSDVRPLVTARVGARIELPGLATEVDTPAEVVLEDGSVRSVTIRGGKVATVPAIGEAGYHRLRFADREITLAVAPARCVTLEEVGAGRRMWGVAAQVYGLRRAGDGGIGDAGAVRDLAEAAARRGADAVALSPVHSLFAADPARHGPYSPSSRLFLNPLYGDPSIVFDPERLASHAVVADEQAPLIDWTAASAAKFAMLRRLFDDFTNRDLAVGTPLAADFERFVQAGGDALHEHALFEALHAERPGNWVDWPAGWRQGDATAVRYHLFLQWIAARSFAAAQTAARAAGMRIGLIG